LILWGMIKKVLRSIYGISNKLRMGYLQKQGLKLGKNVFIGRNVLIDPGHADRIFIGDDCTITSRVIILAHDATTKRHIGYTKVGDVSIGKKTFIGVGSIILPNVEIGENVIIGAGSVVTKDVPDNSVVAGNPAKVIGNTSDYIKKHNRDLVMSLNKLPSESKNRIWDYH
jgi:maltose O-acetyltransferase